MTDPAPIITPEASPARVARGINALWIRWGTLIAVAVTGVHFVGSLYLDGTYAKKDDLAAVRTLVYDRTRPISEHVAGLESKVNGIDTKLDEREKRETERAAAQVASMDELKRGQHDIELYLRQPRR